MFWNHPAREITEITTGITGTIGTETTVAITIMIMIVRKEKTRNSQHFCRHLSRKNVHQVRTSPGEENRYLYLLATFLQQKMFLTISGPKHFQRDGHNYFFSKFEEGFEEMKGDWLEGRNFCREYCMDLVSLETQEENDFFIDYLERSGLQPRVSPLNAPCFR